MEEKSNNKKVLQAARARNIRELVDKTNQLKIPKDDVVAVLQESGYYVILYYYKGE